MSSSRGWSLAAQKLALYLPLFQADQLLVLELLEWYMTNSLCFIYSHNLLTVFLKLPGSLFFIILEMSKSWSSLLSNIVASFSRASYWFSSSSQCSNWTDINLRESQETQTSQDLFHACTHSFQWTTTHLLVEFKGNERPIRHYIHFHSITTICHLLEKLSLSCHSVLP